jgi:hypothetical protein
MMFDQVVVDGSTSCIPGEQMGDEYESGEHDHNEGHSSEDGTPKNNYQLRRGNNTCTTATGPKKKSKSPMVRIMKGMLETKQTNYAIAQKVMQGELRASALWSTRVGSIVGSTSDMTHLVIQLTMYRSRPGSIIGHTQKRKRWGRFLPAIFVGLLSPSSSVSPICCGSVSEFVDPPNPANPSLVVVVVMVRVVERGGGRDDDHPDVSHPVVHGGRLAHGGGGGGERRALEARGQQGACNTPGVWLPQIA